MSRQTVFVTYLTAYLFAIGTAVRYVVIYTGGPVFWPVTVLVAVFLALFAIEPWLSRCSRLYTHLYLALQTGIAVALSLIPPKLDYFALLLIPLALQAMHAFQPRIGFRWIGVFVVVMAALMFYGQELGKALAFVLTFTMLLLLLGSYSVVAGQAEIARQKSQGLLDELQTAHRQLQRYVVQAESVAVTRERERLARNLHDSVTQTLFTMTLTSEAARLLFDQDPARAVPQLDKLQVLARSTLAEMSSLISALRPATITQQGLIPALAYHVAVLKRQQGLKVALNVIGEPHLSREQARRLFRVIQEALNNVVKHARTDQASVTIQFEDNQTLVQIEDEGKGFVLDDAQAKTGHIGLSTMRERVEMMGGTLTIDSSPGRGTRVAVDIPRISRAAE
jgi:signal transduction histidine kinase